MKHIFSVRKRQALDGIWWWCVYDETEHKWSTFLCHGKYKRKRDAERAIKEGITEYSERSL